MKTHTLLTLLLISGFFSSTSAQIQGDLHFETLGIKLTLPDGWMGQEYGDGIVCGSNTEAGLIYLTTHNSKNMDQMRLEAQTPQEEGDGTSISLASTLVQPDKNTLAGEYEGYLEYQAINAYILATLNPYGKGVMIMAATSPEAYSPRYKELVMNIFNSIRFSQPILPPVVKQWQKDLQNSKLTYMSSYSSFDYSDPNITTGGSTSSKEVIDLCSRGYFNYYSSSFTSVTGGTSASNATASGYDTNDGNGTWEVIANAVGQPVLELQFYSGEVYTYVISSEDSKTFLNGERYYYTDMTSPEEYKPDCF
ncbi:MAG: hypothetical protein AAGC85_20410 [Bacteroidota bacterium]